MTPYRQIAFDVHAAAMRAVTDQADYYQRNANSALARRWELAVDEIIYSLLKFPLQGSPCNFRTLNFSDIRSIAVPGFQKHLVFYRFSELQNSLVVVYVAHGARDYEPLLAAALSE